MIGKQYIKIRGSRKTPVKKANLETSLIAVMEIYKISPQKEPHF